MRLSGTCTGARLLRIRRVSRVSKRDPPLVFLNFAGQIATVICVPVSELWCGTCVVCIVWGTGGGESGNPQSKLGFANPDSHNRLLSRRVWVDVVGAGSSSGVYAPAITDYHGMEQHGRGAASSAGYPLVGSSVYTSVEQQLDGGEKGGGGGSGRAGSFSIDSVLEKRRRQVRTLSAR